MPTSFDTQSPGPTAAGSAATEFSVAGMNCNNCARHVGDAIQSVNGVRSAMVSLEKGSVLVRWSSRAEQNVPAVIDAVKKAGYTAREISPDKTGGEAHSRQGLPRGLWLGIVVTAALMSGEWIFRVAAAAWFQWGSFVLAAIVQAFSGAPFYRGAWNQLKRGHSNMDTLVALGSTTAFGYSAWALFSGRASAGEHLYFMEAAAIITLISLGHWIEARVSRKAGGALKALLQLAPQTARRVSPSAFRNPLSPIETDVPVSALQTGDLVLLRPGDHVPVDGVVVEGASTLNQTMLTGESNPVEKKAGDELYAGTVNLNGRLVMRVTATGEETALANVIAAVQRAQTSRADIQRLGDRVSSVFVPCVVAIAVTAGLWWGLAPDSANKVHTLLASFFWHVHTPVGAAAGFIVAAAVLIIACPCAMGLATPAAIMAGANTAARRGILIRDGVALEKAGSISAILFDKTGTLTSGKSQVEAVEELGGSATDSKELAAALAQHSTHPISQSVARIAPANATLEEWNEIRGSGIEARSPRPDSRRVRLGSLNWLRDSGVDLSAGEKFSAQWCARGATVVGLAVENRLAALFAVGDSLKPDAAAVVDNLRRQGLKIFLVTGDNSRTALAVAQRAGISSENVFAEVRPGQKAGFVKKLQARGERVAFVGDGINDAPALTQADLGIAVGRASDIAREAADIVLLKSEIEAVPEALGLARATLRIIRQNLFWAFFYNALGVPLAALGFVSPIFCAAAMGFSDLIVIGNALRLLRWEEKPIADGRRNVAALKR